MKNFLFYINIIYINILISTSSNQPKRIPLADRLKIKACMILQEKKYGDNEEYLINYQQLSFEFREIQKIVADSLLNKDAIQDIRNKIQKSKENVTKKNIDDKEEKEINISDKIKELRKLNYSINDNNQESMKKYISKLEDDLEEKEAFIKELLFEEYIHQENCDKYQNKIEMQIKQIEKYNQKIHELEKLAKKSEHEKSLLNKKIHILNNEIDDFKDKVLYLSKEKSELNEKIKI